MLLAATDTHPLLYYAGNKLGSLGTKALRVFQNAERADGSALIHIPSVVLVECFLKIEAGVKIRADFDSWVDSLNRHPFFRIQPMDPNEVIRASKLVGISDPFDRMIAASALEAGYPLITRDQNIVESTVVEVWWDD